MAPVHSVLFATAPALLLLARAALADLQCAPPGVAYCSSSSDMATINSATYALNLAEAGTNAFILGVPGAEALKDVIGQGVLSQGCLSCQGAMLDCSATQFQCFEACAESSCGQACRSCIEQACSVQKACGGVPGRTLQYPFTCPNPSDSTNLAVDKNLLNLPFKGSCSSSEHFHVNAINIPIRPRPRGAADTHLPAEEANNAIVIPIESESAPDGDAILIPSKNETADLDSHERHNIVMPIQKKSEPWTTRPHTGGFPGVESQDAWVSAQMQCASSGTAYCASSQDMNVINNAAFATGLTAAASEVFINQVPGSQAIETTIGKGRLTSGCLACQGGALDCAVQQTQCYQFCVDSSCSAECRGCIQQKCDVAKACGGEPGVSIQNPYSCTNNDPHLLHVNRDLLSLPFTGLCSRRLDVDRSAVIV